MKKITAIILAAIALSACSGGRQYVRTAADFEKFHQDVKDCGTAAEVEGVDAKGQPSTFTNRGTFRDCMKANGWLDAGQAAR